MDSKEVFNHIFNMFNEKDVKYVIIHSYQNLPQRFDSDIDTAINVSSIKEAIILLDNVLKGTGWKVIQYWRHENYAADCVISNDKEFLQIDFCIHYERNGRVVMSIDELLENRYLYKNFYVPSMKTEFTYILLKKILKKFFSENSKEHLYNLWSLMSNEDKEQTRKKLKKFFNDKTIDELTLCIENSSFSKIDINAIHKELKKNTSNIRSNFHYKLFDMKRRVERVFNPTGLFIVLLGVDGAGKTTISNELERRYVTAFRRIDHYHSRVRVLKDISQIKSSSAPIDTSNPHKNKYKIGKAMSVVKFGYYFLDFLIGNFKITVAKIKSTLVLIERYYYDYSIDKVRYNLNLTDNFIKFFGFFIKKPDAIFILTGDSQILLERKYEITIGEINSQKTRLEEAFKGNERATFIDTTTKSVDDCVYEMLSVCNRIMRERRKWK